MIHNYKRQQSNLKIKQFRLRLNWFYLILGGQINVSASKIYQLKNILLRQRYPAAYSICTLPEVQVLVASALSPEQPARIYKVMLSTCHLSTLFRILIISSFLSCVFAYFCFLCSSSQPQASFLSSQATNLQPVSRNMHNL